MHKVSSEIYKETNFQPTKTINGKVVSKFRFAYPNDGDDEKNLLTTDEDGDLIVKRKNVETQTTVSAEIEIEHSESTNISLVGLQVWRGALLMADFFFHRRREFCNKQILELGAGVGLTSIAAAIYAQTIICTDVDIGGILNLIRANIQRNQKLIAGNVKVLECDFMLNPKDYTPALLQAIDATDIVYAADVIYDDQLTDAFIRVIDHIFDRGAAVDRPKIIYVALEKRFVFTLAELDSVAPMFEYFVRQTLKKSWRFEYMPTDFPQYFVYERSKELVLLKLSTN